jgi:hypothetical protein
MDLQNLLKQFSNLNMNNVQNEKETIQNDFSLYPEPFNTDNNKNIVSSMSSKNNYSKKAQGSVNGLFGPNSNLSSIMSLFSMLKGKQNFNSLLNSDSLPEDMKGIMPLISMLSSNGKKSKDDEPIIDKLKKIED